MKKRYILFSFIILVAGLYFYLEYREVNVIDTHRSGDSLAIIVDHLPLSESGKIDWWLENKNGILAQYADNPLYITFFAFGDGYQELGKKDRLCFNDINPPKNCIDKNILMSVLRMHNGDLRFGIDYSAYVRTKDGRITKVK
ncbi:DUF943 family protein [Pantoea cypripedii]|uniref:DUF943 domain-containing protein n=1 Tax=Pantoea cypripedii TaxID=55209 RepID=A0A6B9FVB7_PANCY|nr:DUF943 family protein [Pantoea cypripedii]QGY27482.1 hypothetical protein CUN67_00380 [Pantoea cypripedii]